MANYMINTSIYAQNKDQDRVDQALLTTLRSWSGLTQKQLRYVLRNLHSINCTKNELMHSLTKLQKDNILIEKINNNGIKPTIGYYYNNDRLTSFLR